jgi:hypothetical protein
MLLALAAALALAPGAVPRPQAAPVAPVAPVAPDLRAPRPAPSAPARQKGIRIALPEVRAPGLEPRQLALFEGALLQELRKLEGVSAIGMGEIREMLSFEYQKQMLGCASDESCLAEIGGALGTDEMLSCSILLDGKTATLALKRIDMKGARITGSDQRRLVRANGEELLAAIGPAVQVLFPDRLLRPGRTRGVAKEVAVRLNPPPLPRWAFYATAGSAAALAAAGLGVGYMSRDARDQYRRLADRSTTEVVPGSQLRSLEDRASSLSRSANLLFLASGGLALAAGVEAFFTDWHGYRAAVDVAPGKAGVQVGKRF